MENITIPEFKNEAYKNFTDPKNLDIEALKNLSLVDIGFVNRFYRDICKQNKEILQEHTAAATVVSNIMKDMVYKIDPAYVLIEESTKLPFISEQGDILVFSDMNALVEAYTYISLGGYAVVPCQIEADLPTFYAKACYMYGVKTICFDIGRAGIPYPSKDLAKDPCFESLNPELFYNLLKFQQFRRFKKYSLDKSPVDVYYLQTIDKLVKESSFVIPVKDEKPVVVKQKILDHVEGLPLGTIQEYEHEYIPLYMGMTSFKEDKNTKGCKAKILSANEALFLRCDAFIINPHDLNYLVSKSILDPAKKLFKDYMG